MDIQTEQLLGTLEVLLDKELDLFLPCHENGAKLKPFVWDTNIQGAFTPLNLIQSEGWMAQTDIELAFNSWQWSEDTCLAAKGIFDACSDYLDDRDDENIVLDNETKIDRGKKYQVLRNAIEVNIPCIQAFTLSSLVKRLRMIFLVLAPLVFGRNYLYEVIKDVQYTMILKFY